MPESFKESAITAVLKGVRRLIVDRGMKILTNVQRIGRGKTQALK